MFAIIIDVLRITFGVLWDRARDTAATRLQGGDLTDEQCRQLVVRELDDIKTKLDALARKDFLAGVAFLEEGVCKLKMALDRSNDNQNEQTSSHAVQAEAVVNNASCLALSQTIAALRIVSHERFSSAKASFKAAREKATEAFSNEALSLEDRILATKVRVMSTLLENLEDPETAVSSCLLFVEALHKMPAVQKNFSVHVNGGIKARFNKSKRLEIVKSVTVINVFLFIFAKKFTALILCRYNWPCIRLGRRVYWPCFEEHKILNEIRASEFDPFFPYEIILNFEVDDFSSGRSAVNSKREIITRSQKHPGVLNVIDSTGEIKAVCRLPDEDTQARGFEIQRLAIDADDSVYVVTSLKDPQGVCNYKLFVFDSRFVFKKQVSLDSFGGRYKSVNIAVNKDKKVVIHCGHDDCIYVCDSDGKCENKFDVSDHFVFQEPLNKTKRFVSARLSISDENEIIVAPWYSSTVYIHTEKGELKQSIKLPKDHVVCGVAFHHVTKKLIAYAKLSQMTDSYHLLCYSQTGNLQETLTLLNDANDWDKLTSHPSGSVALVHGKRVIFI